MPALAIPRMRASNILGTRAHEVACPHSQFPGGCPVGQGRPRSTQSPSVLSNVDCKENPLYSVCLVSFVCILDLTNDVHKSSGKE
jgi:hypothetical protein